jgi:hypothetical protein
MNKAIKISSLIYEMLVTASKTARLKPEEYAEKLIENAYNKNKR